MLAVSEIFYSLQGEGEFIGTPSVFLRLGGCNLKCEGFGGKIFYKDREILGCDSIYAANSVFSQDWIYFKSSKEIIDKISSFSKNHFDLILTGGEPTLHFKNPILLEVIEYFLKKGHKVCVESNGSVKFEFDENLKKLHFTLSIKLSNSLEPEKKRINIFNIQNIINHSNHVVFKFVLNARMAQEGIKEIKNILNQLTLKSNKVYLMPQGSSVEDINEAINAIYPLCLQEGYCLSDRLHIRIWGDKRGF